MEKQDITREPPKSDGVTEEEAISGFNGKKLVRCFFRRNLKKFKIVNSDINE